MKKIFAFLLLNIFSIALIHSIVPSPPGQQQILDQINSIRRGVSPQGSDIREVGWSQCLAEVADTYLQDCDNQPGSMNENIQNEVIAAQCEMSDLPVGQTVFTTTESGQHNPFAGWISQGDDYDYDSNQCSASSCRDYLQLVNARTSLVGCASFDETICGRSGVSFACYYANSLLGEGKPYTEGESCTRCVGEFSRCNNGLCVAGTSTVTYTATATPETPDGHHHHGHKHPPKSHDHDHNTHDHGRRPDDDENSKNTQDNEHKSHKHGHKHGGKSHDHARKHGKNNDNDNDNEEVIVARFGAQSSSATSSSIMAFTLIASILFVLFSSV